MLQKPYACQVPGCDKRYTDPSSLRKHAKNHLDLKNQLELKNSINSNNNRDQSKSTSKKGIKRSNSTSSTNSIKSYCPQKSPKLETKFETLNETELKVYNSPNRVSHDHVPCLRDDSTEYIPYENVERFLIDDKSHIGIENIGKY